METISKNVEKLMLSRNILRRLDIFFVFNGLSNPDHKIVITQPGSMSKHNGTVSNIGS